MPTKTPGTGHNGGVTPSVMHHHMKEMQSFASRKAKLAADEKAWKAKAKDDGIDVSDLKWSLKQSALSIEEQIASHNRRMFYLECRGSPIAVVVPHIADGVIKGDTVGLSDEERLKNWDNIGFLAAKDGKGLDVAMESHDPNSVAGRAIRDGWDRGMKENGAGIKKTAAALKAEEKATKEKADADAKAAAEVEGKAKPQHEPEVAEAGKKRAGAKAAAVKVTYWHNPEDKAVQEVKDGTLPEKPWISIARGEFDTLKAEYEKLAEEEFNAAAPGEAKMPDFDDGPPAPGAKPN